MAIATNVLCSATETHGIRWYREEFKGARDRNNQPTQGMNGPNPTVQFVLNHVPVPERWVGIFELSAHLVIRPMADTFQKSTLVVAGTTATTLGPGSSCVRGAPVHLGAVIGNCPCGQVRCCGAI
ncbi:hypothetical protein [Streptomyces sp. NPDC056683]|uniref:hypothetical protein n=1 Tax=Streptomyces sp. NPDC056683 TaxID=3345910 RepID=UPI00369AB43B